MSLSRRKFLSVLGGGAVVAATGVGTFAATRTPTKALAPWGLAGSYDDPRMNAVSFGLLAPNPHNMQPWLLELSGEDTLVLHRNPEKALPMTDPFDRQIRIGLGCFLEQTRIAASAAEYDVAVEHFPDGEGGPIAKLTFREGDEADPLAAHILDRRSGKHAYSDALPSSEHQQILAEYADIIVDPKATRNIRELTIAAFETEMRTPRTLGESIDVMRIGKSEINANPDGLSLNGAMIEALAGLRLVTREQVQNPDSTAFGQIVSANNAILASTPAFAAVVTKTNSRHDQLAAGSRWLRLNLTTTALGLSLHPVSQCLQEYPEMADHYVAAHTMLAPDGGTVQMLGRLGYGPKSAQTPRWPVEAKLVGQQAV